MAVPNLNEAKNVLRAEQETPRSVSHTRRVRNESSCSVCRTIARRLAWELPWEHGFTWGRRHAASAYTRPCKRVCI